MAAWSESFVAIAASVSTTSTKQRVLIFRDEIPTILTNSGELLGCLVTARMLRNWFLCFAYVLWTSSLWIFSLFGKLKQGEILLWVTVMSV